MPKNSKLTQKEILNKSVILTSKIKNNIEKTKKNNLNIKKKISEIDNRVSKLKKDENMKKMKNIFSKLKEEITKEILENLEKKNNFLVEKKQNSKSLDFGIEKKISLKNIELQREIKNSHNNFILQNKGEQLKQNKILNDDLKDSIKKSVKENLFNFEIKNNKKIDDIKNILNHKQKEFAYYIQNYIDALENKKRELEDTQVFEKIKKNIEKHTSSSSNKINSQIKNLENKTKRIEDETEKFFEYKIKENVKNLDLALKIEIKKIKKEFDLLQKQELAKIILNFNCEFETLSKINRNEMLDLKESVGSISIKVKDEFKESFDLEVKKFEKKLSEKQNEFLTKLIKIEGEKEKNICELEEFKESVSKLTKEYIEKAHIKIEEIQVQKNSLDYERKTSIKSIQSFTNLEEDKVKKIFNTLKEDKILKEFDFKKNYLNKIQNLQNFTSKKLEKIEENFLKKNVGKIKNELDFDFKTLNKLKEDIQIKIEEQEKEFLNLKVGMEKNFDSLDIEKINLQDRIEKRSFELEKELNKRFLDYDNSFSILKGVIINEVEGVIKDTKKIIDEKISYVDKFLSKMFFEANEISKNFKLQDFQNKIENLEKRFEIIELTTEKTDINNYVNLMQEYETKIQTLIQSLKEKNISNQKIEEILVSKGHPKFYLRIILNNYNCVY